MVQLQGDESLHDFSDIKRFLVHFRWYNYTIFNSRRTTLNLHEWGRRYTIN